MSLIDETLLIDLISEKRKELNIFEIIIFIFLSNIEIFIAIAFIIDQCYDASVISIVYPISYFAYALIEYPFPSRYYWRYMIYYSISIISIKLFYQLPFFCGYPFLAMFNIFSENHCEYYNLSNLEITESFAYIIGLRKYNGDYSYPKNGVFIF